MITHIIQERELGASLVVRALIETEDVVEGEDDAEPCWSVAWTVSLARPSNGKNVELDREYYDNRDCFPEEEARVIALSGFSVAFDQAYYQKTAYLVRAMQVIGKLS